MGVPDFRVKTVLNRGPCYTEVALYPTDGILNGLTRVTGRHGRDIVYLRHLFYVPKRRFLIVTCASFLNPPLFRHSTPISLKGGILGLFRKRRWVVRHALVQRASF